MLTKDDQSTQLTYAKREAPRQVATDETDLNGAMVRDHKLALAVMQKKSKVTAPWYVRLWVHVTTPHWWQADLQEYVPKAIRFLWVHRRGWLTEGEGLDRETQHCFDCSYHKGGYCDPPGILNCRCGRHRASKTSYKCRLAAFECPIEKFPALPTPGLFNSLRWTVGVLAVLGILWWLF